MNRETLLTSIYQSMLDALGESHWWPADTPFEMTVGAILTQNTNWKNVERAIDNLKAAGALNPDTMAALAPDELAELIRPSGYFRVKAQRLQGLIAFLHDQCDGDISLLSNRDLGELRPMILSIKGVGPETADSILLYALNQPSFVVDAYTRRILSRHGLLPEDTHYEEVREFFMDVLPPDPAMFNEYHALLVRVAKEFCLKKAPQCEGCPLREYLD
ncbi:endonuclease III domain-containing protein [Desulfovibrio ferrophilus]|uniref:Endonuclease III n=1 Tax=Desulfovibrio ferrophilus TaxID=241368 RepID=A0A2Z6AY09_9BACT|nr:endonuclease III domain-containing protein [Desulfovibrio ferrophilus]BBD08036.1 endonuclease III [Desulfovibrio ferrophilus]